MIPFVGSMICTDSTVKTVFVPTSVIPVDVVLMAFRLEVFSVPQISFSMAVKVQFVLWMASMATIATMEPANTFVLIVDAMRAIVKSLMQRRGREIEEK